MNNFDKLMKQRSVPLWEIYLPFGSFFNGGKKVLLTAGPEITVLVPAPPLVSSWMRAKHWKELMVVMTRIYKVVGIIENRNWTRPRV